MSDREPLLGETHLVERLRAAGCVTPEEEAQEMVAAAPGGVVPPAWPSRRERGEPLAWITGGLEVCGRWTRVDPGVYVPRIQSEELAQRAAELMPRRGRAVDLCCGSGAIAAHLAAEVAGALVVGVDIDPAAAACATRNGVTVLVGDLDGPLRHGRCFDVVTAVTPYVPTDELRLLPADVRAYEPRVALDGGADGLEVARRLVPAARTLLRRGGWLLLELGGDQDERLAPDLAASGFAEVESWQDEDGDLRGLAARLAT
ncbi:MAG: N5-glutamine methyltransferase family protein [Acidimicrobiales bacterium]